MHTSPKGGAAKNPDLWKMNQDPFINPATYDAGVEAITLPDLQESSYFW